MKFFPYILLAQEYYLLRKPEDLGPNPWAPQGERRASPPADVLLPPHVLETRVQPHPPHRQIKAKPLKIVFLI